MEPSELTQWIALHRAVFGAPSLFTALLERFGSVPAIFSAGRTAIIDVLGGHAEVAEAIVARASADDELAWASQPGAHVVTIDDDSYPPLLRETADPPPLLYVRGDPALLSQPQLAIVGSRNPTPGGCDNARAFAQALGEAGLVITSGMAAGVDTCAHRAAVDAGRPTIAILGTGIDRVYPASNRELAHAIAERGALVSDLPFGAGPKKEHFPRRNRLIAGLSLGVLVVEAARQSGSLITARLAGECGREVFAIPGSIHSPLARGCHRLIRSGAKLVESAADVIEELRPLYAAATRPQSRSARSPTEELPAPLAEFLEQLGFDPIGFDTLVERAELTAAAVSSMLTELELRGRVASLAGGRYQRRN
jgi:DNA processing protein